MHSAEFPAARVTLSPQVSFQEMEDELVLLDLRTERYFGLNTVGARAWCLLQEHGDPGQVFAIMQAEFDVDADVLAGDLRRLIAGLADAGLVTVEPTPQADAGD